MVNLFKKFSPLNKRRWMNFKANRRGYYALWIFLILLLISLPAEFIANDKPLIIYYKHKLYFPIFKAYSETEFGGILETEADFKDPFVTKDLIKKNGGKILWPIIPSKRYDPGLLL